MRTSFVFIIVSLFLAAVYADTDVCETTTAEVKAATRILNTWRAACEDHGWKGATCYNYWAQLNEVMTLENNLQTCLTGIFQQQKELMLGTSTEAGLYSADAAATRDVDNVADAATKKLVVDEQTSTRDHVTSTINNVIQTTVSDLSQQSDDTRATVSAQFTSTKNAVKADNTDARSAENTSAKNIKDRVVAQETETRTFVDSAHDLTRSQISNAASVDGTSSRTNNNKQEASTRATMLVEATNTQSVVNAQAQQTQQLDLAQEKQTRGNTVSEHTTSRSTVDTEHTSTRQTVADAAADEKNAVNQAETANRQAVNDDAAANLNFVSASAGSARSLFSGLQTALVSSLLSEQSTMSDDMWGPFVRILVHYDLQGKACDKFGDTFTFATLSSAGAGRFEQLRGEANETMVFNEKMYGTNRVGYARYYWNNAESYLNNRNYRSAAEQYRLCYNEATQPH